VTTRARSVSSCSLTTETPSLPTRAAGTTALLIVLGALSAFGPLTTDLYLPGLPDVGDQLDVAPSQVQATLTACLIGLAVGQAIAGPLSDTYGRRRPLLIGLGLFVLASIGCAIAPSILVLDVLRLVQGLCGAAGIVLARAIVRDRWTGLQMARIYAALMGAVSLGPILAPPIGGLLLKITDWRGLFVVLAGFGLVLLVGTATSVPETLAPEMRRPLGLGATLRVGRRLLGDRLFAGYTLSSALAFGALFSYISGSSFVYQDVFDVSAQVYGLLFALNGLALLIASVVNHRLQESWGPERLLRVGMLLLLAGSALLVVVVLAGAGLAGVVPTLVLAVAGLGFVPSNAVALALEPHAAEAGTASALIGVVQFLAGAIAAPLPGIAGESAVPMAVGMVAFAVAAIVVLRVLVGPSHAVEQARQPA
jgi:DHA1 family bicyclomycin/chloramphenicol resistance-like MFS transporter